MRRTVTALLAIAGGVLLSSAGSAQVKDSDLDRVVLAPAVESGSPWVAPQPTVWVGAVQEFDANQLVLKQPDGKVQSIGSHRVEQIQIHWANEPTRQAMELVAQRQYRAAITALDEARTSGIPRWQARFVVAEMVRSADALGNTRTAGVLFLNLTAASPPPLLYRDMPLCWTVREADARLSEILPQWMASDDEASRLLGASWELMGAQSAPARDTLRELQSSDNQTIAQLAFAQSWRLSTPPETMAKLDSWVEFRDSLIEPLQIGPTEFLADRLTRMGRTDLAIGQWMRIVSLHADRYHRAANALEAVSSLLSRSGRTEQANGLMPWIDQLSTP